MTTRLFDDFERTHEGPADPGESLYAFLNRFADLSAAQARSLCERWFEDYSRDVPDDELKRFVGDFRNKDDGQHYAAWFELLTHQILVRLGFDVTVEPNVELSGRELTPDFAIAWNGSRILVEATVVAPDNDPFALSNYERDARDKFAQLEIENFTAFIASVSGTLNRRLKKKEIEREFAKCLANHDPDVVQQRFDQFGATEPPVETIRFGNWQSTVELIPLPPDQRTPKKARVTDWLQARMHDAYVPQIQEKIRKKLKKYRQASDRLVLAINVHGVGRFTPEVDGHDVLFEKEGIWNGQRSSPVAILFVTDTNSSTVPYTPAFLFVNPSVDTATLPPALFRLRYRKSPRRYETFDGESVATILGLA